ncbi:unnamed protein product, partial [Effrenium voratum]
RLEARVRSLEGQGVRSDRRAAELAGLAQALTDEQRALLIRLDRVEDLKRRDCQVPEERMARLEQEQRSLALELRLSASVAEEAQQKQLQRLRTLEDVCDHRLHALEQGPRLSREVLEPVTGRLEGRRCDSPLSRPFEEAVRLEPDRVAGLQASVEELRGQLEA